MRFFLLLPLLLLAAACSSTEQQTRTAPTQVETQARQPDILDGIARGILRGGIEGMKTRAGTRPDKIVPVENGAEVTYQLENQLSFSQVLRVPQYRPSLPELLADEENKPEAKVAIVLLVCSKTMENAISYGTIGPVWDDAECRKALKQSVNIDHLDQAIAIYEDPFANWDERSSAFKKLIDNSARTYFESLEAARDNFPENEEVWNDVKRIPASFSVWKAKRGL